MSCNPNINENLSSSSISIVEVVKYPKAYVNLYNMGMGMRQEKRHKLQLFYDIICAVEDDMVNNESARPTHVQHYSRLSYDKMLNYVDKMEKKGMIFRGSGGLITITNKGREFTRHYSQLINLIESAGL